MKISIITPMYNSGQYIGRMIQALQDLDYQHEKLEFLIIDNGSDDDSVKIVHDNKYNYSKVEYFCIRK